MILTPPANPCHPLRSESVTLGRHVKVWFQVHFKKPLTKDRRPTLLKAGLEKFDGCQILFSNAPFASFRHSTWKDTKLAQSLGKQAESKFRTLPGVWVDNLLSVPCSSLSEQT